MRAVKRYGPNIVTALILTFCAVWYIKTNLLRQIQGLPGPSDFSFYYRAGQTILNGRSPYDEPAWFYPPLTAFLMTPFALVDYLTARWIWLLISHAFLVIGAWVTWRAIEPDRITLCSIACVWAFGGAASESLMLGQIGPLLVLVIAFAYTRGAVRQGTAAGIGFVLKYLPGILAFALLLHRSWRALAVFTGVVALGVIVPWIALLGFSGAKAPTTTHYWMGTPEIVSFSVPSVVLRILDPPKRGPHVPHNWEYGNVAVNLHLPRYQELASASAGAILLIAGAMALILVCKGRLNREQLPWAMAGLISLSLAAAPVCWSHYQILQYPGVALLVANAIRLRAWPTVVWTVGFSALLYPLPVSALTAYYNRYGAWTATSPATLYFWSSVAPLACMGLFVIALSMVRTATARPYCATRADLM